MLSNLRCRRVPICVLAITLAGVSCNPLPVARAAQTPDAATARAAADARVNAASTSIEKINALADRAHLPDKMKSPTRSDWQSALADINATFDLIAEIEKDGKTKVSKQAGLYFWRAYVRAQLEDYAATIADYDRAESAGYAADFAATESKGSELWNNRGQAKTHLRDYKGGIADFDIAIDKHNDELWRENRAQARFELGDYEGARSDWKIAQQLDETIGAAPFDEKLAPLNKAVADNPGSAAPLVARAKYLIERAKEAYLKYDKFSERIFFVDYYPVAADDEEDADTDNGPSGEELMLAALDDLDLAVKVEPTASAAWLLRGRARALAIGYGVKPHDLAFTNAQLREDFTRAINTDSKNAAAWYERGKLTLTDLKDDDLPNVGETEAQWAARRRVQIDAAILDLSRAIYLAPNASGELHYLRAYAERLKPNPDRYAVETDYGLAIAQNLVTLEGVALSDAATLSQAHEVRGQIFKARGEYAAAIAEFDAAIKLNPKALQSHQDRGALRALRGQYGDAIADFDIVINARPDYAEAWLFRATARDGLGQTELAKSDLAQALKRDASLGSQIKGSRYDEANPHAEVGIAPKPILTDQKIVPAGSALDHKNAGNALRQKGDLDGALTEYTTAILIDPNFSDAYNNRGGIYTDRGEVDLALADDNRAIELDPKHRAAYLNRALVWRELGEYERARTDLDRAIDFTGNDEYRANVYHQRAITRRATGDKDGARQDAERATTLAPKNADLWSDLGDDQLNAGQSAASIGSYRRALELAPDALAPRVNLALTLAQTSDASAPAELDRVLAKATPEQIQAISATVEHALKKSPENSVLKMLQTSIARAPRK